MNWLRSIAHDIFGHPVGLRHGGGECGPCNQSSSVAFCTQCKSHFIVMTPTIGRFH